MCDCISYNRPDLGGTEPEVVLTIPANVRREKPVACVDACMVPTIKALWDAGIPTINCCCGHNGKAGKRSVIVDPEYAEAAKAIVGAETEILFWRLGAEPVSQSGGGTGMGEGTP